MSRRQFKPGLIPTFVALLVFIILLALGTWQMSRSHDKQALLASYHAAPAQPLVAPRELDDNWQSFKYRKMALRGRYDNHFQVLIENQLRGGEYGYIVLTPLRVAHTDAVILVNRGWLKRAGGKPPEIGVSEDIRAVTGLVGAAPGVGMRLGTLDDSAPGWPKYLPYIDFDWLALQIGGPVSPWVILLHESEKDGFARDWRPVLRMGPEKHQGYAFQWYALAILLVFLFVVGGMKSADKGHGNQNEPETDANAGRRDVFTLAGGGMAVPRWLFWRARRNHRRQK